MRAMTFGDSSSNIGVVGDADFHIFGLQLKTHAFGGGERKLASLVQSMIVDKGKTAAWLHSMQFYQLKVALH